MSTIVIVTLLLFFRLIFQLVVHHDIESPKRQLPVKLYQVAWRHIQKIVLFCHYNDLRLKMFHLALITLYN
jgi:hypothetical protein